MKRRWLFLEMIVILVVTGWMNDKSADAIMQAIFGAGAALHLHWWVNDDVLDRLIAWVHRITAPSATK